MVRKTWILALALAVPAVSIAQERQIIKKGVVNESINTVFDCTAQFNHVLNCTFQSGDFTNWLNCGDPSFTSVGIGCGHRAGTNCASMGQSNYNGTLTQALPNTTGTCTLSFWLDNTGQPSRFSVEWNAHTVFLLDNVPNFAAQQFTVPGLPGGFGAYLTFTFYNPPSFMHLSDVSVTCP